MPDGFHTIFQGQIHLKPHAVSTNKSLLHHEPICLLTSDGQITTNQMHSGIVMTIQAKRKEIILGEDRNSDSVSSGEIELQIELGSHLVLRFVYNNSWNFHLIGIHFQLLIFIQSFTMSDTS